MGRTLRPPLAHPLTHSPGLDPRNYAPKTLRSELQRRSRLPPEECVQLALNLTLALGHLHRHGLIHRDIKPANIIFVQDIPKLADIGLVTTLTRRVRLWARKAISRRKGVAARRLFSLGRCL